MHIEKVINHNSITYHARKQINKKIKRIYVIKPSTLKINTFKNKKPYSINIYRLNHTNQKQSLLKYYLYYFFGI